MFPMLLGQATVMGGGGIARGVGIPPPSTHRRGQCKAAKHRYKQKQGQALAAIRISSGRNPKADVMKPWTRLGSFLRVTGGLDKGSRVDWGQTSEPIMCHAPHMTGAVARQLRRCSVPSASRDLDAHARAHTHADDAKRPKPRTSKNRTGTGTGRK